MRVILTCNYSPWSSYSGGGQRSTHNLAQALAHRRHHVSVVFTRAPWERVAVPADLPYQVHWATLTSVRGASPGPLRLTSVIPVARAVAGLVHSHRSETPVVHSQGEESAGLPSLRRRRRLRFGFVVTPRSGELPDSIRAWQNATLVRKLRAVLLDSKYVALGVALRGADFCSPPSAFGGRLVQRAYALRDTQMEPVHNGVPVEFLDFAWSPGEAARPLVFFGRFGPEKGIDTLLDALERLGSRAPEALFVGRGSAGTQVDARLRAATMAGRVRLHGWADHGTLGRILSEASMAVLPSRVENLSLSILAALAVGTPLITTAVGGTPEVVEHERTGLLVNADDAGALADAIARLDEDRQLAARLSAAGREHVRRHFTWDHAAARFEDVYARAVSAA